MIHLARSGRSRLLAAMLLAFVGLGGSVLAAQPASAVIKLPTATTLTVTPSSNPYFSYPETYPYAGVPLTLTATVVGFPVPTGTVTFRSGSTVIGSAALIGVAATIVWRPHQVGTLALKASYAGSSASLASASPVTSWGVQKAPSMVNLETSPVDYLGWGYSEMHSVVGQPVTIKALVRPVSVYGGLLPTDLVPSGSVQFHDGATLLGTAKLVPEPLSCANGCGRAWATLVVKNFVPHTVSLTATYVSSKYFASSTNPIPIAGAVTPAPVEASLIVSDLNPVLGQAVTITQHVWAAGGSVAVPTGSVKFLSGATVLATKPLVNGVASLVTTRLPAGPVDVSGSYLGTARTLPATVTNAGLAVSAAVTSDVNPVSAGYPVHLTASVDPSFPAFGIKASGTVTFNDGATVLGSASLANGVASIDAVFDAVGAHRVTVKYSGDSLFGVAVSPPLTETVTLASTLTNMSTSANPSSPDDAVTFDVFMMSSTASPPTGSIEFRDGTTVMATVPITSPTGVVASFATGGLAPGGHAITARYSGDLNHAPSTSSAVYQVVREPAVAVSAGLEHACALRSGGSVSCWGANSVGQLGDGSAVSNSPTPVGVSGISTATAISSGREHSCALLDDGTVRCWGANGSGQLGDGTVNNSSTPVAVSGITAATAIDSGGFHTCALLAGGTAKCWGDNEWGQLGDGTTTSSSTPVAVSGLTAATTITSGDGHSCSLDGTGSVQCWGFNAYGQLGDGTNNDASTPVAVTGVTGATGVSAGGQHTCALVGGGLVQCWGYNGYGQLGNSSTTDSSTPGYVTGVMGATAISAGGLTTCALGGGGVRCTGINDQGQLGRGTQTSHESLPALVSGSADATAVTAGGVFGCALRSDATIACWGYNGAGELGDGTTTSALTPVTVRGLRALHVSYNGFAVAGPASLTGGSLGTGCTPQALTCDDTTSFAPGDTITLGVQCGGGFNCIGTLTFSVSANGLAPTQVGCPFSGARGAQTCSVSIPTSVSDTSVSVVPLI